MTIPPYIIVTCIAAAAAGGIILLLRWSHRRGIERAKAEAIREANRLLEAWICRYCGLLSLIRNDECIWCSAPRPEEYISRMIAAKDFSAQIRKAQAKLHAESSGRVDL
ncbi:MAG TPA: hypothetical protein VMF59_12245 [Bacteroidota bacterium]|nr:hypothetical protein [Bacteroidota bacterium]